MGRRRERKRERGGAGRGPLYSDTITGAVGWLGLSRKYTCPVARSLLIA